MLFTEFIKGAHSVIGFDCGNAAMNDYLRQTEEFGPADDEHLWIMVDEAQQVQAFITTRLISIYANSDSTAELVITATLVSAMGVSVSSQKRGMGRDLFQLALVQTLSHPAYEASQVFVCLPVHDASRQICRRYGFRPMPGAQGYVWLSRYAVASAIRI